jgi:hypothetical protein
MYCAYIYIEREQDFIARSSSWKQQMQTLNIGLIANLFTWESEAYARTETDW